MPQGSAETKAKLPIGMASTKVRVRRRLQMAEPQRMQWFDEWEPLVDLGNAIEVVARQREMQRVTGNVETIGIGRGDESLQFVGRHPIPVHR